MGEIMMKEKPDVKEFADGTKSWSYTFETFKALVYVPKTKLPEDIINFGYDAPYLLVLPTTWPTPEEAKAYADESGLSAIAGQKATSVVYIYPTCQGGWQQADESLFVELIANSKIHEYHKDGYAILNNRFTKSCDGYAIRGAIYRTLLFGKGESADYIASKLLKTIDGDGLWGPADITLTACVLEDLSVMPQMERQDIPIVSVHNSEEINEFILDASEDCYIAPEADYKSIYEEFLREFMRWGWVGTLEQNPDFDEIGMIREPGIVTVKTSKDNCGDDKGTENHRIGYLAYYNKGIFDEGAVPLVICFHGGGDSAMHIAQVSQWYKVAHDHNFLLVCVENHLNSTATESVELIEKLCEIYNIDETRIYGSGFSMGGCKSWDLYQEYPQVFAGLAPMSATFDVGHNIYDNVPLKEINRDCMVPIFYAGGEITPLPELPFQAQKCLDRMQYVFEVNDVALKHEAKLEEKDNWVNPIWGVVGDRVEEIYDNGRDATLTLHYFDSNDGNCYTVFGSISGQGHECRYHTCEQAWLFLSKFRRMGDKSIETGACRMRRK